MSEDVVVHEEFFPAELGQELIAFIDSSGERKQTFALHDTRHTPSCVRAAAAYASQSLGLELNMAILKWYRNSDDYDSQAYTWHVDPESLRSIPLVLCTLKGLAELYVRAPASEELVVQCTPNRLVLLSSHLMHRVSPPMNAEGERYLLFLGFDSELESTV